MQKEYFSYEMGAAFDVLFLSWFNTRDVRVREQVVEALGVMAGLLDKSKVLDLSPKLIAAYLPLYSRGRQVIASAISGKEFHLYVATQSFNQILCASFAASRNVLQPHVQEIMSTLFNHICALVDYSQPHSLRNHNELLRCFATLTKYFNEPVIAFILQKLENNNANIKSGALATLKHIINACTDYIETKLTSILFALRLVISEQESNKVKKLVAQVIVAIAHHGFLVVDGGQTLIKFVVKQCALPPTGSSRRSSATDPDDISNEALRHMCENVMNLLVTTVDGIETVLWPHLFELMVQPEYSNALPVIYRSLAQVASKVKADVESPVEFDIDFANNPAVPQPHAVLARLAVTIGTRPAEQLIEGVRLMQLIAPLIHKALPVLWSVVLDKLLREDMLEKSGEQWQASFLALVNQSLIEIDDIEFTKQFGKALLAQMAFYREQPDHKHFLLHLLGNVIRRLASKSFSLEAIDAMFNDIDHGSDLERRGLAYAIGQTSAHHLDLVLVRLEHYAESKRGSGLLNLVMDSVRLPATSDTNERVRAAVMLCYGQACKYAPPDLLVTRIETPILRTIATYYEQSRDPLVKKCFLESVKVIAESVHPKSLNMSFTLRSRNELLHAMISVLKDAQMISEQQTLLAVDAIASLVQLDPPLGDSEKINVIEVVSRVTLSTYNNEQLITALHNVVRQIVIIDRHAADSLELCVRTVAKWLVSKLDFERENGIEVIERVLASYLSGVGDKYQVFEPLGALLALLLPGCFDSVLQVRYKSFVCMRLSCAISDKMRGRSSDQDATISGLERFADACSQQDKPVDVRDLTKVVAQRLQLDNCSAGAFLTSLSSGINDTLPEGSIGACDVIKTYIETRGGELDKDVPALLSALSVKLHTINSSDIRRCILDALNTLAKGHLAGCVAFLLKSRVPLDDVSVTVWRNFAATDDELCKQLVHVLLDVLDAKNVDELRNSPSSDSSPSPVVTHKSVVAVCALREIFSASSIERIGSAIYGRLFACLFMVVCEYVDGVYYADEPPLSNSSRSSSGVSSKLSPSQQVKPGRFAVEALKTFFVFAQQANLLSDISSSVWRQIEDAGNFPDAVIAMSKAVCSPQTVKAVACLEKDAAHGSEKQRLVRVAIYSELVAQKCTQDAAMVELLTNSLLNALNDESPLVRCVAIRGLGRVAVSDTNNEIVSALSCCVTNLPL